MAKIKDIKNDPSETPSEDNTPQTEGEEYVDSDQISTDDHPEFWRDKGKEEVLHQFTEAEMLLMGQELVQSMNTLAASEANAKADAADWKGMIKIHKAEVDKIKRSMEEGQEVKYVDTEIRFHYPKRGHKQVVRTDNREVLRTLEMTVEELQMPLFRPDLNTDNREEVPGFDTNTDSDEQPSED
jgi:hypothetical protein